MADTDLPKEGRTYRIWSVIEDIILERLDQLEDERMRDSYYLLREWLEPLRDRGDIIDAEFDYFVNNYEYYRDDLWPRLEERHGIRRPETKPPTIVIEDGEEYTESRIYDAWERSRGFIFVEKSGMAEDLTALSHHGWLIVAAQGESTRTFREKVANDDTDRPVLVVTDADFYGGGITESLQGHSNRTEHLDLAAELHSRVQEIGLTQEDADALDLPRERDPTQSPDEWRTELNALAVLKERQGIETPLLSYVAAKMSALDIPLCPLPIEDPDRRVRAALYSRLTDALEDVIHDAIDQALDGEEIPENMQTDGDGPLMKLRYRQGKDSTAGDDDLVDQLADVAEERYARQFWWRQSAYEDDVKEEIGADDVDSIEAQIPA